jgi:hypothetical protein
MRDKGQMSPCVPDVPQGTGRDTPLRGVPDVPVGATRVEPADERSATMTRARAGARHGVLCCGAKTRAGGSCRAKAMRNGKCRMHGGLSTGPKTAEGRARIAAAQKFRWSEK